MPFFRHFPSLCCAGLLFLACLESSALDPHHPLRHYGYQAWQTDDGLPQNTVHAVLQTRDGYIWFATEAGVVRFDGAQFAVFNRQNTPQLGSNLIYGLFEDQAGALWICTAGGLTRLEHGAFRLFTAADGLPANSVWSAYQGRDGSLWAVTGAGLAKLSGQRHFQPLNAAQGLSSASSMIETPDGSLWLNANESLLQVDAAHDSVKSAWTGKDPIEALAVDSNGRFWVGSHTGLTVVSPGGEQSAFPLPQTLGPDITCLLRTSNGHIWIGTSEGLGEYDGNRVHVFTTRDGLPGSRISSLYEDREHAVWAATDRGIARIAGGSISALTSKDGLSSNQVLSFFEDREGSLWLGTESGGAGVLRDRKFTTYTTRDGLTDDLVRSVYQDHAGAMLIGTNGGGVNRLDGASFSPLSAAAKLSSSVALSLADDDSNLWIGTPDGLNQVHDGRVRVFTSADGLADDFVRSLYADRSGGLWIGTRHGLSRYQDGKFTTYTATDGLGSDLVGAVLEDEDRSFWIGTLGGLTHFAGGRFTNYTVKDGLSGSVITALDQDRDGTLWIGTNGGGLNARAHDKFVSFAAAKELPQEIYGILDDDLGNLWLGSSTGVYRVNKKQLMTAAAGGPVRIEPDVYGTADGMAIRECSSGGHPAAWKAKDGSLWFATLRGVTTVHPAQMPVNRTPPLVAIEQVTVDDATVPMGEDATIAPGHTRFAFQYAGLSFVAPQKVRFRYKLDGLDKDWIDAGGRRIAYYTNIPAGRHTFHVMACNNDGVWSEEAASFSFRLRPHFYQTYWFYLAVLASLALLSYEAYRWRVRAVESQFNAVLAERNRIAREIHDTLAQGFVAVSVQLEVVARLLDSSVDAARQHLGQARKLTQECLAEARSSIWNLRSQGSAQNDLASALTAAAERITGNSEVKARVLVSGTFRPLDQRIEAELLKIGQEALTNVVRHAQARSASITLLFGDKLLSMTIKDDGRGFDADPGELLQNGHFGLTGMRERAAQIGGRLTVTSAKGEGTEVRVEIAI